MEDRLISLKAAIDAVKGEIEINGYSHVVDVIEQLPSAQPEPIKIQIDHELTHDEFERLRKDMADAPITLLPSAQLEQKQKDPDVIKVIRCKDCKHFEYDHLYVIQGIPVLAHELCNAWGDGCKTNENGYCFLAERKTDEGD